MKRRAFTLVELLIVIGAILILSAAAVSGARKVIRSLTFGDNFNKLVFMVQRARNTAISGKDTNIAIYGVRINPQAGTATYFTKNIGGVTEDQTDPPVIRLRAEDNFSFTAVAGLACTEARIEFVNGKAETRLACEGAGEANKNPDLLTVNVHDARENTKRTFSIHKAAGVPQVE